MSSTSILPLSQARHGDKMTCCGTCDKRYHVSCEEGKFTSKDWKCRNRSLSKTIHMKPQDSNLESKDTAHEIHDYIFERDCRVFMEKSSK